MIGSRRLTETLVNFMKLTPHNNPEASDLNKDRGESLKSYTGKVRLDHFSSVRA